MSNLSFTVYNFSNPSIEYTFHHSTGIRNAVRFCYAEETNRLSYLLDMLQRKEDESVVDRHFPVVEGGMSISCGDWGVLK